MATKNTTKLAMTFVWDLLFGFEEKLEHHSVNCLNSLKLACQLSTAKTDLWQCPSKSHGDNVDSTYFDQLNHWTDTTDENSDFKKPNGEPTIGCPSSKEWIFDFSKTVGSHCDPSVSECARWNPNSDCTTFFKRSHPKNNQKWTFATKPRLQRLALPLWIELDSSFRVTLNSSALVDFQFFLQWVLLRTKHQVGHWRHFKWDNCFCNFSCFSLLLLKLFLFFL